MSSLITVDASKARDDFFKILDKVYKEEKEFLIKKSGISVAKITKLKNNDDFDIMDLAGAWKDVDTKKMIKYIYEGRKDKGELKRKLPSLK